MQITNNYSLLRIDKKLKIDSMIQLRKYIIINSNRDRLRATAAMKYSLSWMNACNHKMTVNKKTLNGLQKYNSNMKKFRETSETEDSSGLTQMSRKLQTLDSRISQNLLNNQRVKQRRQQIKQQMNLTTTQEF